MDGVEGRVADDAFFEEGLEFLGGEERLALCKEGTGLDEEWWMMTMTATRRQGGNLRS